MCIRDRSKCVSPSTRNRIPRKDVRIIDAAAGDHACKRTHTVVTTSLSDPAQCNCWEEEDTDSERDSEEESEEESESDREALFSESLTSSSDSESEDEDAPIAWNTTTIQGKINTNKPLADKDPLLAVQPPANQHDPDKMIFWMFKRFFPVAYMHSGIIHAINQAAKDDKVQSLIAKPLTPGEFLQYLGILIYMRCYKMGGNRRKYWREHAAGQRAAFPFPDLGRYMKVDRFEDITRCFTVGENNNPEDPIRHYRGFLDAVNNMFSSAIIPGRLNVIDESMVCNKHEHAAARVYIPRKPQPWGHELWTNVDCKSGILIRFVLNEGRIGNKVRRAAKGMGKLKAQVATTIECLEPWLDEDEWRIILADSWFMSVRTCRALYKHHFLCIGPVKTAHVNFPRGELDEDLGEDAGATSMRWTKVCSSVVRRKICA